MEYLPYILLIVILLMLGLQLSFYLSAKGAQGKAAPPYDDLLEEKDRAQEQLLFYFHSEHCGPCRQMTPLMTELAQRRGGVVIIDVGHHAEAARRFGVRVTPTLMRVKGGIIDKVVVGAISESKLQRLLSETA